MLSINKSDFLRQVEYMDFTKCWIRLHFHVITDIYTGASEYKYHFIYTYVICTMSFRFCVNDMTCKWNDIYRYYIVSNQYHVNNNLATFNIKIFAEQLSLYFLYCYFFRFSFVCYFLICCNNCFCNLLTQIIKLQQLIKNFD